MSKSKSIIANTFIYQEGGALFSKSGNNEDNNLWRLKEMKGIRIEPCYIHTPIKEDGTTRDGIVLRPVSGKNNTIKGGIWMQVPREDIPGLIERLQKYYNETND